MTLDPTGLVVYVTAVVALVVTPGPAVLYVVAHLAVEVARGVSSSGGRIDRWR